MWIYDSVKKSSVYLLLLQRLKNLVVIRHAKGLKVRKYHEEPSPHLIYTALGKDQAR